MTDVSTLQLNVWEAAFAPDHVLPTTRFQLGHDAQEALAQWSRERTGRSDNEPITVILRGLHEVLAWFAPDVAFVRHEWDPAVRRQRLCLYFVGDRRADDRLKTQVRVGLQMWLNSLYPDKDPEVRGQVAACAQASEAWRLFEVDCGLKSPAGVCALPSNTLFWDAMAAHAVSALAGQALQFRSGEQRVLVAKTAQASAYEGLELVAFPPKRGEGGGFWSEVITLHTPTYPERGRVHLLARPSIRNWGPVTFAGGARAPHRSLDAFVPPDPESGRAHHRHTSFEFRARKGAVPESGGPAPVEGFWPHKDKERVFDLLRRLSGRKALAPNELAEPVIDQEGLWVLPRLGTVHGDDQLAGGSGVAWPDRHDIGDSLQKALQATGFERAEPMQRRATRMPLEKPFNGPKAELETAHPRRRKAVLDALAANGGAPGRLTFYVFHLREATPQTVAGLLREQLGLPETEVDGVFQWGDGLSVRIVSAGAGPLSEQLPRPDLEEGEGAGMSDAQRRSLLNLKRDEATDAAIARMSAHIAAARAGDTDIACALLEMPKSLLADSWTDPFQLARRELARNRILPQVVLVDGAAEQAPAPAAGTLTKAPKGEEKYAASLRDCIRVLGVLPVEDLPEGLSPAALTIVQRNRERVGGGWRDGQAIPLAIRVKGGCLECGIPDENDVPVWTPYAAAALRIFQGDYGKFGRGKQPDNIARFEGFFSTALSDIDRAGPALVMAEGETLSHKLNCLTNGHLEFDRLKLGSTVFVPRDLPNTRLVRVSPDPKRQPYYYHETDNRWPSGIFGWGVATRTFYALKTKPKSVSNQQSYASQTSRHGVRGAEGDNLYPPRDDIGRVSAQIDEICVVFHQADDAPLDLATLTHRLRGAHTQTQTDTILPFPLHELRLLAGGITL